MTDITTQFGAYFANGIIQGEWHRVEGDPKSTLTVMVSVPGSEFVTEYHYDLTYEMPTSYDGTRNFFYQHKVI